MGNVEYIQGIDALNHLHFSYMEPYSQIKNDNSKREFCWYQTTTQADMKMHWINSKKKHYDVNRFVDTQQNVNKINCGQHKMSTKVLIINFGCT